MRSMLQANLNTFKAGRTLTTHVTPCGKNSSV